MRIKIHSKDQFNWFMSASVLGWSLIFANKCGIKELPRYMVLFKYSCYDLPLDEWRLQCICPCHYFNVLNIRGLGTSLRQYFLFMTRCMPGSPTQVIVLPGMNFIY